MKEEQARVVASDKTAKSKDELDGSDIDQKSDKTAFSAVLEFNLCSEGGDDSEMANFEIDNCSVSSSETSTEVWKLANSSADSKQSSETTIRRIYSVDDAEKLDVSCKSQLQSCKITDFKCHIDLMNDSN